MSLSRVGEQRRFLSVVLASMKIRLTCEVHLIGQ